MAEFVAMLVSLVIGAVVGKTIFALVMGGVCLLLSLLILTTIVYLLVKTFGTRTAVYVMGGSVAVIAIGTTIWTWSGADDPVVPTVEVRVTKAIRGNAFETPVGIFGRRSRTVTLLHIGVPATDQVYGRESRDYLNTLIRGKQVIVRGASSNRSDIGGIVVAPEGWVVQQAMVKAGAAWCTGDKWRNEEAAARKEKRGLWSVYTLTAIDARREGA